MHNVPVMCLGIFIGQLELQVCAHESGLTKKDLGVLFIYMENQKFRFVPFRLGGFRKYGL